MQIIYLARDSPITMSSPQGPGDDLTRLFDPRGVAIIGATATEGKIGHTLMRNLVEYGYKGGIYPINPKAGEILGRKTFADIRDVPDPVDVAAIVVPADKVLEVIDECGQKGVSFLVIITSGFKEIGRRDLENELVAKARSYGMRVLGPNIFGIYSAKACMNCTFGPKDLKPGNVALISQSGALGIALMGRTITEGLGVSAIVSVGNKADIDDELLLRHFEKDPDTDVVMIYMEGTRNGRKLIEIGRRVVKSKAVIIIKAGSSSKGAQAAASHTGSLAGSDKVFDAAFHQAGFIRAITLEDAFDWLKTLVRQPLPHGHNTLIITNGGGIGVMTTDECDRRNVTLLDDPPLTERIFKDKMPAFGSAHNPVDLTGQSTPTDYAKALEAALMEPHIHAVICLYCEAGQLDPEEMVREFVAVMRSHQGSKPVIFALVGGKKTQHVIECLNAAGLEAYSSPSDAVDSLQVLYERQRIALKAPWRKEVVDDLDVTKVKELIAKARDRGEDFMLEHDAKAVFEAAGLRVPKSSLCKNLDEAVACAKEIGYPVVLKIQSKDILHKSDVGGVKTDLDDDKELADAYGAMMAMIREKFPNARIEGVSVNEQIDLEDATECIIGTTNDPSFGPVIMFGLGGIYVEILKDVVFRVAPITRVEAASMIREIKSSQLLYGARGQAQRDIAALADVIHRVSLLVTDVPEIRELDVNPIAVLPRGDGCIALDARIGIKKPEPKV